MSQLFLCLLLFSLISQCLAANTTLSTSSNATSTYTHFDLFKNTKLQPCPINSNGTADSHLSEFVAWRAGKADSPDDYCKWMAGTPVVIPTTPTAAAFYPGWPSFATQLVSLLFTYIGLWNTLRGLNKNRERQDMALPKTFWVQLPVDLARILAWYISFFRGVTDFSQFPWLSTVLWTVPFNYIFLLILLTSTRAPIEDPRPYNLRPPQRSIRSKVIIGFMIAVTVIQWTFSLVACIIHYKYTWWGLRARFYSPNSAIFTPSSTLGPLPQACLDYLSSNTLPDELFSSESAITAFCTQTIQFVITTLIALIGIKKIWKNDYRRTYTILRNSAGATQSTLAFSALGLLGYALGVKKVDVFATNDQNVTGPCTFAVVQMWSIWGLYDVEYGRSFRLVLNALGV